MKHTKLLYILVVLLALTAACAPAQVTPITLVDPTSARTPLPSTDLVTAPAPTEMVVTETTSHTDDANGFTFDYPTSWMLDSVVLGSRAPGGYQLTSWAHDPGLVSTVPADGTIMNIFIQLWDPKSDLNAFVEQRKLAWDASGIVIVSEAELTLGNGQAAREFVVKGSDGATGYFLFSTLGEDYLVASGSGDIDLVRSVAGSLR